MRAMRSLLVFALAAPLGGCFSLTAQKTVPDWAMAQAPQATEQPRRAARAPAPRGAVAERPDRLEMPTNTGNVAMSTGAVVRPAPQPARSESGRSEPANFSPEWYAREKAADEHLRRSMNICRGC